MLEIVVFVTLIGIGYIIRRQQTPDSTNPYSTHLKHYPGSSRLPRTEVDQKPRGKRYVDRVEKRYADKAYKNGEIASELSGTVMSVENFSHNNMVPFFRGSVKQAGPSQRNLETFTGVTDNDFRFKRDSTQQLFNTKHTRMTPDEIIGTNASSDYLQDFHSENKSITQNNVLPFKQERVGPGILGETDPGYQQFKINEVARPKTTDDTRSKVNPKTSYEARIIDGQKNQLRGDLGHVRENRYVTFISKSFDHFFKTLGAFGKPMDVNSKFTKDANKRLTNEEIQRLPGGGGASSQNPRPMVVDTEPQVRQISDRKTNIEHLFDRKKATDRGQGAKEDHGKSTIVIYDRDRSKTSTVTTNYQGGLSSLVKAIIAPLQDVARSTPKKQNNPQFSAVNSGVTKGPVKDPDDIAKRTIRQDTTETFGLEGNLRAPTYKLTVFDPDDIMRKTTKELMVSEADLANVKGPYKLTVYDPNEKARKTGRETIDTEFQTSITGAKTGPAYDPVSIRARTTAKEQYSEPHDVANLKASNYKGVTYDPESTARKTNRETTDEESQMMNFFSDVHQARTRDPDDRTRTTLKESMNFDASAGSLQGGSHKSRVHDPEDVMPTTLKEAFSYDSSTGNIRSAQAQRVHDPEDRASTTLKEQLVQESSLASLQAAKRTGRVYDPDDRASTTLKEQLIHESSIVSLQAAKRIGRVHDSDDVPLATIKEQYAQEASMVNMSGPRRSKVHDPDDKLRTTSKETLNDDVGVMNASFRTKGPTFDPENILKTTIRESTTTSQDNTQIMGPRKAKAYDPSDVARVTIKQGFAEQESELGPMYGAERHAYVKDTDDIAKSTIKEGTLEEREFTMDASRVNRHVRDDEDRPLTTLKDASHIQGHVQGARMVKDAGYTASEYDAVPTFREMITKNNRETASATRGEASAYKVIKVDAPDTTKQYMHGERTGIAGSAALTKETSYANIYNAAIDGIKESTLIGRDFVGNSSKESPSLEHFGRETEERLNQFNIPLISGSRQISATSSATFIGQSNDAKFQVDKFQPPGPFDIHVPKKNYDMDPSRNKF